MGVAVVVGASGGIGRAIADALEEEGAYDTVHRLSRSGEGIGIDITDEESIRHAAQAIGGSVELVIVATGLLHSGGKGPEKAINEIDTEWLVENFRINAIGPVLIAKHFLPLMPRERRGVFAVLSARVGSISDNRLGGWHSYRASKAALNQLIRTLAIEHGRTHKRGIVVALHPGTVDTALSKPFQANLSSGTLFTPERAALQLLDVLDDLKPSDSGQLVGWDGSVIAP